MNADEPLAGASTLCRLEQRMGREDAARLHRVLVERFIRNRVDYIVGIARNATLAKKAAPVMELAAMAHEAGGKKVRVFDEFPYAAASRSRSPPGAVPRRRGQTATRINAPANPAFDSGDSCPGTRSPPIRRSRPRGGNIARKSR